jgi:chromosome segregation ATPase
MSSNDDATANDPRIDELLTLVRSMDIGIRNLGTRVEAVEGGLQELRQELDTSWHAAQVQLTEIRSDIRKLDRKFDLLNQDVMEVRADQRDVNRRVDKLEEKAS